MTNTEAPLKATLVQSVNGALQGQLKDNETLSRHHALPPPAGSPTRR